MLSFSLLWARVALGCYLAGLAAAIGAALVAGRNRNGLFALARAAVAAGFLFQFVSLAEMLAAFPLGPATFYRLITGLLAFIIAGFFLMAYRAYSPRALTLVVAPLICVMAAAALLPSGAHPASSAVATSLLHNGWIYVHIAFIFIGYAGLVVAMASGVLYLFAERGLKSKHHPISPGSALPSLETLDRVGYRSLLVGFPLLTAGLVIGAYWADALFGGIRMSDPTVLLALLAWAIYLVLLFARWSAGWRGRRSAYLTLICFGLAVAGWLANGASQMHSLLR
ncbi:MAG: cytochrome C assembly family protein [Terriglobales bacterium]